MGNPKFSIDSDSSLLSEQVVFGDLMGTEQEVKALQKLVPSASVYTQEDACKTKVLGLHNPRFLHIATHGYNYTGSSFKHPGELRLYQSMFGSGLCLSGINDFLQLGVVGNVACGTGFLSSMDILNLNLNLTELTFLSACETGVGLHADGEGIIGIRRAFYIEGTWTQIVRLWKIPDQLTVRVTEKFYALLFQDISDRCFAAKPTAY